MTGQNKKDTTVTYNTDQSLTIVNNQKGKIRMANKRERRTEDAINQINGQGTRLNFDFAIVKNGFKSLSQCVIIINNIFIKKKIFPLLPVRLVLKPLCVLRLLFDGDSSAFLDNECLALWPVFGFYYNLYYFLLLMVYQLLLAQSHYYHSRVLLQVVLMVPVYYQCVAARPRLHFHIFRGFFGHPVKKKR